MAAQHTASTGDSTKRGGPKTAEGKRASCRNAVKHGLTAEALVPEILRSDLVRMCYRRLRDEWKPDTPTQEFLVVEMARHQAALERSEQMEEAALRRGARGAPTVTFGGSDDEDLADAALAGAGTSDAIERIARYRKPHERAFLRSLAAIREAKEMAGDDEQRTSPGDRQVFTCEAECEAYLVARLASDEFRCPRCQNRTGKWIASRKVWQCRECNRQTGVRVATVMEKSRLGLMAWFRAIEALLRNESVSTADLSVATGIRRKGTVRRMAGRIRPAMKSPERSSLLAGLDRIFGAQGSGRAEPSVRD